MVDTGNDPAVADPFTTGGGDGCALNFWFVILFIYTRLKFYQSSPIVLLERLTTLTTFAALGRSFAWYDQQLMSNDQNVSPSALSEGIVSSGRKGGSFLMTTANMIA
jgi:hypothetical protein